MPNCNNCGAHVTRQYVRVFGVDGEVNACVNGDCSIRTDRVNGAGAGL